jgi:hypothetical protein
VLGQEVILEKHKEMIAAALKRGHTGYNYEEKAGGQTLESEFPSEAANGKLHAEGNQGKKRDPNSSCRNIGQYIFLTRIESTPSSKHCNYAWLLSRTTKKNFNLPIKPATMKMYFIQRPVTLTVMRFTKISYPGQGHHGAQSNRAKVHNNGVIGY